MTEKVSIAVIGGSGLYHMAGLQDTKEYNIQNILKRNHGFSGLELHIYVRVIRKRQKYYIYRNQKLQMI